jgi:hypothetical protein
MATLNNPINAQNIVDRFADYVQATANAGIVWYNNGPGAVSEPFPEFNEALLGGSGGKAIEVSGTNLGGTGSTISTNLIYSTLREETNRYTRIRNLRARRLITTGPGNRTRPDSDARDTTNVAHLTSAYQGDVGSVAFGGVFGSTISASGLETFFDNLRTSYNTIRGTSVQIDVSLCHNSCHGSCHGSRGRR